MINKCYINGCSWTYGAKLANPRNENFTINFNKQLKFNNIINDSLQGGSNHRIVRTTIEFLLRNKSMWKDLLVIIGWTCPHRIELWSEHTNEWLWINQYRQQENSEKGHRARAYYEVVWDEVTAFYNYFQDVYTLQSFLKQNNIKYYMFRSFAFQNPLSPTNEWYGMDADRKQYYQYVDKKIIPSEYLSEIDPILFPSFINFEKTWHWVIKDCIREDGRTFMQHYPVHPNKEEHDVFGTWLAEEIKQIYFKEQI